MDYPSPGEGDNSECEARAVRVYSLGGLRRDLRVRPSSQRPTAEPVPARASGEAAQPALQPYLLLKAPGCLAARPSASSRIRGNHGGHSTALWAVPGPSSFPPPASSGHTWILQSSRVSCQRSPFLCGGLGTGSTSWLRVRHFLRAKLGLGVWAVCWLQCADCSVLTGGVALGGWMWLRGRWRSAYNLRGAALDTWNSKVAAIAHSVLSGTHISVAKWTGRWVGWDTGKAFLRRWPLNFEKQKFGESRSERERRAL